MQKVKLKDVFTIPNIICYVRIILIPFFCYIYINANTINDYYLASLIVLFSSFTDLFDGFIARKFNMVTDLGKVLDPIADKLTHLAIALCLLSRYSLMVWLLVLMIIKEGYMLIMGSLMLKKGKMMNGAMWFGKVCTATMFVGLFVLFLFPTMHIEIANLLIIIMIIVMIYTFIRYILFYKNMIKE